MSIRRRRDRATSADGALAIVVAKPDAEATLVVTTYDLDDTAFTAAEQRWTAWWHSLPR